jgi:hypothetical protein
LLRTIISKTSKTIEKQKDKISISNIYVAQQRPLQQTREKKTKLFICDTYDESSVK